MTNVDTNPAGAGVEGPGEGSATRRRILQIALSLMAQRGVDGTSMRDLASAAGLNVASLYHYFPSKRDLLESVLAEQGFMPDRASEPEVDIELVGGSTLAQLVADIIISMFKVEDFVRLMVGEAIRGDTTARTVGYDLFTTFESAIADWISTQRPDLTERCERGGDRPAALRHGGRALRAVRRRGALGAVGGGPDDAGAGAGVGGGADHRVGVRVGPPALASRRVGRMPAPSAAPDRGRLGDLHRAGRRGLVLPARLRQPARVQPRRERAWSGWPTARPRRSGACAASGRATRFGLADPRRPGRTQPVELWAERVEEPTLVAAGMSGGSEAYEEFVVTPLEEGGCSATLTLWVMLPDGLSDEVRAAAAAGSLESISKEMRLMKEVLEGRDPAAGA